MVSSLAIVGSPVRTLPASRDIEREHPLRRPYLPSLRKGGGLVDAPGGWLFKCHISVDVPASDVRHATWAWPRRSGKNEVHRLFQEFVVPMRLSLKRSIDGRVQHPLPASHPAIV